jgi:hypothetical protein
VAKLVVYMRVHACIHNKTDLSYTRVYTRVYMRVYTRVYAGLRCRDPLCLMSYALCLMPYAYVIPAGRRGSR